MTEPLTPENHITNRRPRIMGIIVIVVGLLLAKWQIYDPLHGTEQHRQQVWLFSELIGAAVYLPAYGLLLLVFGRRPNKWFTFDPQNLSLKNVLSLLAFGAVGLAAIFFVISSLEGQGYVVKHGW